MRARRAAWCIHWPGKITKRRHNPHQSVRRGCYLVVSGRLRIRSLAPLRRCMYSLRKASGVLLIAYSSTRTHPTTPRTNQYRNVPETSQGVSTIIGVVYNTSSESIDPVRHRPAGDPSWVRLTPKQNRPRLLLCQATHSLYLLPRNQARGPSGSVSVTGTKQQSRRPHDFSLPWLYTRCPPSSSSGTGRKASSLQAAAAPRVSERWRHSKNWTLLTFSPSAVSTA